MAWLQRDRLFIGAIGLAGALTLLSMSSAALPGALPYTDADSVVRLWLSASREGSRTRLLVSSLKVAEWRSRTDLFVAVETVESCLSEPRSCAAIDTGHGAFRVNSALHSGGLFELLGVRPLHGRLFSGQPEEFAVLSEALWRSAFSGDPEIIGRPIRITIPTRPPIVRTVAGILPKDFQFAFPVDVDFWFTDAASNPPPSSSALSHEVVARMAPGITVDRILSGLNQGGDRHGVFAERIKDYLARDTGIVAVLFRTTAWILAVLTSASLGLLGVVDLSKHKDRFGIRRMLGATPIDTVSWWIQRQIVCDLIALIGAGILCALAVTLISNGLPQSLSLVPLRIMIDREAVALTTFLLILGYAIVSPRLITYARGRMVRVTGITISPKMGALAVPLAVQFALTVCLLATAVAISLFIFHKTSMPLGFSPNGVVAVQIVVPSQKDGERRDMVSLLSQITQRVKATGSLVSIASDIPFGPKDQKWTFSKGQDWPSAETTARVRVVDEEYFRLMKIPLLHGREFLPADDKSAPSVAIVSAVMASSFGGVVQAIGRRVSMGGSRYLTVVGVVGDVVHQRIDEPPGLAIYLPIRQNILPSFWVVARPQKVQPDSRTEVLGLPMILPASSVGRLVDVAQLVSRQTEVWRTIRSVALATLGLVIAVFALCGSTGLGYIVSASQGEFWIRSTLGAQRSQTVRLVMWRFAPPLIVGGISGAVLAVFGIIEAGLLPASLALAVATASAVGLVLVGGVGAFMVALPRLEASARLPRA